MTDAAPIRLRDLIIKKRGACPLCGKGVSLRAASRECGVSVPTLSRIVRGHVPDAKTLIKLCRWLNIDARKVEL